VINSNKIWQDGKARQMKIKRVGLLKMCGGAVLLAALSGCVSNREIGGDPDLAVLSELPAPTAADYAGDERPYVVGPYDRLVVDVFGIDGLANREVQVDATGNLSFPLAGLLYVAGRTPRETEMAIAEALREAYVLDPQVTVAVKETGNRLITIDGRINSPGLYPVVGRMTLMQLVARSGGVAEYADLERVVVFRKVEGQRMAALYDLAAIRRGAYADPEVYANDVVLVDDSKSQLLFRNFTSILTQTALPIVILADRLTR
jgi:polysaccharide biosynthesis/export protein